MAMLRMTDVKSASTRIEPYVFWTVLLISVFPVLSNTYFATLDGPAHAYNARLLTHYASNPVISTYYSLNATPSPNLFGHLSLSFLNLLFSSVISEKIMVIFYFISFPLSFRYFVKCYNPQHIFFSLIAIPLSHSCLMYMGFYNFSIAFTFMFLAMGLYYSSMYRKETVRPLHYLMLFVLISLTYLSGVLSFVYVLAVIAMQELHHVLMAYKSVPKQRIISRLCTLLIIVLPASICLLVFYNKMQFPGDTTPNNPISLLRFLFYFKSLTVYDVASDKLYTRTLLAVILFLTGYILLKYRQAFGPFLKQHPGSLIFLLATLFILVSYFLIPNGSSAGMMTDRLCNLFFISLTLWIGSQQNIQLPKFVSIAILIPHFFLLNIHSKEQKDYSKLAVNINRSAEHIEKNSVVLPVNLLQKWLFVTSHFPNYLGSEKPLIILDNYEAVMPWFPLNWDLEKMPRLTLNHKEHISMTYWPKSNQAITSKEIDYVYVLGDLHDLEEEQWLELKSNLDSAYVAGYLDPENKISIYKHK